MNKTMLDYYYVLNSLNSKMNMNIKKESFSQKHYDFMLDYYNTKEYSGIISEESEESDSYVIYFSEEDQEVKSSISIDLIDRLHLKSGNLLVFHTIFSGTEIKSEDTFFRNENSFLSILNYSKFYSPISGKDLGDHIDYFKFVSEHVNNDFYICEVLDNNNENEFVESWDQKNRRICGVKDIFEFSSLRGILTDKHSRKKLISKESLRDILLIEKDCCDFRIKRHSNIVYELTCELSNDLGVKHSKKSLEIIEFIMKEGATHALKIKEDVHKKKCIEMMLCSI